MDKSNFQIEHGEHVERVEWVEWVEWDEWVEWVEWVEWDEWVEWVKWVEWVALKKSDIDTMQYILVDFLVAISTAKSANTQTHKHTDA